jgi:hypothetical protein
MSQITIDYDTVGLKSGMLGNIFDYHVANPFYLFAPSYYQHFYASYLMPSLALYNGSITGVWDKTIGFTSQKLLPSIMRGLSNVLFANGIDFSSGNEKTYTAMKEWSKKAKFLKCLKKAYINSGAGGTSLLKLNRNSNKELFVTQHRIDTFFIDVDSNDKITAAKIYIDSITNTVKRDDGSSAKGNIHYGIVEERYFNDYGQPCVRASVYRGSANMQTETLARPQFISNKKVNWEELPSNVRKYIKDNYPTMIIGKEEYLPFKDSLGLMKWCFTSDLPQVAGSPFGQPIGDILQTESLQYDQMKYFERNDVDIARARVLVPEDYINKDDPINEQTSTLSERFYQKVNAVNNDNDKITPIQFQLRANEIKTEKENIYKDIALKLQLSASTVASFLNEGAGARTATEIISERTKTDTWIKSQIALIRDDLNEFIGYIARYYNLEDDIEIVFKCEDQSPQLDKMKAYSDVFGAGHITPELYVKQVFANLSQAEQEREITYLTNMLELDLKQKELALNTAIANFNAATNQSNNDINDGTIKKNNNNVNNDTKNVNVDNAKNQ